MRRTYTTQWHPAFIRLFVTFFLGLLLLVRFVIPVGSAEEAYLSQILRIEEIFSFS